jgi:hypothetical protein
MYALMTDFCLNQGASIAMPAVASATAAASDGLKY